LHTKTTTELLEEARQISWGKFGKKIIFYLPGMFSLDGERGRYPALSITDSDCALNCDHCEATILETMIEASSPDRLIERCRELSGKGALGCLISGGSDPEGKLPWANFAPAIERIKVETELFLSVHTGLLDENDAHLLKDAGVDQALIDVVGDEKTFKKIYHLESSFWKIEATLSALKSAGVPTIPHVVVGLDYGQISGEYKALDMISRYDPECIVVVVFMPLPGTRMEDVRPPEAEEVARILATARLLMPSVHVSLGCARPRDAYSERLEELAVDAGVNRMALWSKRAIERARHYGLSTEFTKTCCSFPDKIGGER
jgi:uncharacterized radical SAM superfamily protein